MRILICPITVHGAPFYAELARALEQAGHEVVAATIQRRVQRMFEAQGLKVVFFPDLMRQAAEGVDVDQDLCREIEQENGLVSIKDVYLADKVSLAKPEAFFVRRTVAFFLGWRLFERQYPIDLAIPGVGTESIRMSAFYFYRARRVPCYLFFHTLMPNSLRIMVNGFLDALVDPGELEPVDDGRRAEIQGFIDAHHAKATPMVPFRYPRLSWRKSKDYLAHVRDYMLLEDSWEKRYFKPWGVARYFMAKRWTRFWARFVYEPPRAHEQYVFYPMHVTRDFKIAVVTPHLVDQEGIIRQISAALPQGCKLYLKEHPIGIGRTPAAELHRLSRIDNVRVIRPEVNTHEMIKGAAAVAVISSTVGFDAMLYSKPVITLGRPYYRFPGLTLDVVDLQDLRATIRRALDSRPDPERLIQFLHTAMRKTFPGCPPSVDNSVENAREVAKGVLGLMAHRVGFPDGPPAPVVDAAKAYLA